MKIEMIGSWADTLAAQVTVEGKAAVHLTRALQRGSKSLIAVEIETALDLLGKRVLEVYMERHHLPWSQLGLHEAARNLAGEIGYEV